MLSRIVQSIILLLFFIQVKAQAPAGYYSSAQGLTGTALRAALHTIIKDHTVKSYNSLYSYMQQTDKKSNNQVWDMYSDIPGGTPAYTYYYGSNTCGSYSAEGDCYNREHSWPQSWFNSNSPMVSDLFHVYPTDGYVNNKRNNYPYGEVGNPSYTSTNGSLLGFNSNPGFNGIVFEPIDEYKGDLARTYFYMCTRYYTEDNGWLTTDMTIKANLKQWAIDLLIKWHHEDPVSTKEVNRNNAVYAVQDNRNPFIDNPQWADSIFIVSLPTAIQSINTDERLAVYPNPASDVINIMVNDIVLAASPLIELKDMLGKTIKVIQLENRSTQINMLDLPKGVYFLEVNTNNGVYKQKIVTF